MNGFSSVEQFQIKRVSIYQNGIAFFHKNGQVDASTGRAEFDALPIGTSAHKDNNPSGGATQVIFGSVRFFSPTNPLLRITVFNEMVETQAASTTVSEILSHNLGQTIQFTFKNDASTYSGKIVSLKDGILLIKMDKGWKQIAMEAIDYLDFTENPNLVHKNLVAKTNIRLDFEQQQKSVPIDLLYFQKGLIWVPNYHVELLGGNKAKLSLKANVLNEAEDLNDATVNFVLGIPSFSNIQEPLFSSQTLESFLNDVENPPRYRSSNYARMNMERVRGSMNVHLSRNDAYEDDPDPAGNLSDEDQFFYTKENLSLPKGGRMLIHMLETNISYEDHYSTQLFKDTPAYNRVRGTKRYSSTVWHSLKFKNESGLPLPTGTIAFVKNENGKMTPISQNRLDFVPADLWAKVKMTQVPDIAVFDADTIKDFQPKEHKHWNLITVASTIEVSNFKKKEITLEITRDVEGELLESDFPWTKSTPGVRKSPLNQNTEVIWVVKLKPGEHKKITYSYKLYVS